MHLPPVLVAPTVDDPFAPDDEGAGGEQPASGISADLPADLLAQVRRRLRLLTALLLAAFAFDPLIFAGTWLWYRVQGHPMPPGMLERWPFHLASLAVVVGSAALFRAARHSRVSPSGLLAAGLTYQVLVCFVIGLTNTLDYFRSHGVVPPMDWIPSVVILFPLVLPGPPRRMLLAAAIAAAMAPLTLGLLQLAGEVRATPDDYLTYIFHGLFAVAFAYLGARVVYGLGREVARARELGSYRLGVLLGRGGMGEVYRASHRMLARPAAIKLIRPELLGLDPVRAREALRRFRREAQVAASLRSPHTVELYDFGVTPDRTFYFVMELLEGVDLESLVQRTGPLPAARVTFLMRQACDSLEEAHSLGLVHRDIKPANLHVGRLGLRHDFLKVLDFGLVKSIHAPTEATLATGGGQVAGTPAYMAPEIAMGEAFDGRADVYALGCVMFFLLTGKTVFSAGSALAAIARHVRDTPTAPSAGAELEVPAALDDLVLRCLAKAPADRPAIRELGEMLAAMPSPGWTEGDAARWWQAHRVGQ